MINHVTTPEIPNKGLQNSLLVLIKEFHKFSIQNGIKYSLTGGSLLGAVRNNGFIPWDTDLDIMVTRENFIKLKKNLTNNRIMNLSRGPWLHYIEAKDDINAKIDIFVYDNCTNNIFIYKIKILLLKILQGTLKEDVNYQKFTFKYKLLSFITNILGKIFDKKRKQKLYDIISCLGNNKKSNNIFLSNDGFNLLDLKHSSQIMESFSLHNFEDTKLFITDKYHDYLTTRYGNYMIPSKDKSKPSKKITINRSDLI